MQIENLKHSADFRSYLRSELVRRTKQNPKYSLRAFARSLQVQSGFLSKILLGQRRVTEATIQKFGAKLGLSPKEIEAFLQNSDSATVSATAENQDFKQIAYDHFQIISDWYHFAILELAAVQNFEPTAKWISKVLGISLVEAQDAIDRLIRLDYIRVKPKGSWELREGFSTTLGTELSASALRKMQKQILEMAILALDNVPVEKRDQTAMTMAIDTSLIPQAKEKITKFRRELCSFLESGKKKDGVYQLSVSLYPVTQFKD